MTIISISEIKSRIDELNTKMEFLYEKFNKYQDDLVKAYEKEKEKTLLELDQRLKERYSNQNEDAEINADFVTDYNHTKLQLQTYKSQLEGFLCEYKALEMQEIRKINKLKKGKNEQKNKKDRSNITVTLKSLRPI